jgi:hypothetical protein
MMTQSSNAVTAASEISRVPPRHGARGFDPGFRVIQLDVSVVNVAESRSAPRSAEA